MEPRELKELMEKIDRERGNFTETKKEENRHKRIRRLAAFNENTHAVIEMLLQWNIPFHLCEIIKTPKHKKSITTDIYIPDAGIVMRTLDMNDKNEEVIAKMYHEYMKRNYYPIFIRSNETLPFIMEKINNTMLKADKNPKKPFRRAKLVKPKKKAGKKPTFK